MLKIRRHSKAGTTLIEVMMAIMIIAGIGLVTLPFVQDTRRMLRVSQAKQACIYNVQNKIKAYKSAKLWAINPGSPAPGVAADGIQPDARFPTGAFYANSTFNWLKARYNLVKNTPGGCVDLTAAPANIYGLRENIDNHGGVLGLVATIPNNACPEEKTAAGAPNTCPGPGPRDTLATDELGGNTMALYVNLQVVSRAPRPNPFSPFLTTRSTGGQSISLARYYNGCKASNGAFNANCVDIPNVTWTPLAAPVPNCNPNVSAAAGGIEGYPNPLLPAEVAIANEVYRNDPNNDPRGPASVTPSPYFLAQPPCPNAAGQPNAAQSFGFLGSDAAIRIVVTGAVLYPAGTNNLWGYDVDPAVALPDGARSNRALMCQSDEVISVEEPQIRYYLIENDGFYDNRGNKVLQNVYNAGSGGKPTGLVVAPDNSMVYVAYSSYIAQYSGCTTVGGVLDCDPIANPPRNYSIPSTNIAGLAIDFNNFPDVFIIANSTGSQFIEARFDPFVNEGVCELWNGSPRLSGKGISIPPTSSIGGMIITPLNTILMYESSTRDTSIPTSPTNNSIFFRFLQSGPKISAISQ